MKTEINVTDDQVQKLRRQALRAGFLRKARRQGKPWKPEEIEKAVRFAVRFLINCVCSTIAPKEDHKS
jgi:hypothetical protein